MIEIGIRIIAGEIAKGHLLYPHPQHAVAEALA